RAGAVGRAQGDLRRRQWRLSPQRACARALHPLVHAAGVGRRRGHQRDLQGWRADDPRAAARRSEAEADHRRRRVTDRPGRLRYTAAMADTESSGTHATETTAEPAAPITSRFLFVDVAAQRAKQLRRGALLR